MASFPFPNKISQSSSASLDQRVIIAQYGDGFQQRAAVGINNMFYTWDLTIQHISLAERNTLVTFYNTHGKVVAFDWTPPNGTPGKYVFATPLVESNIAEVYSFDMQLLQVFE